jgi:carbohydrate kinase (thermoresistant glucokinase family)
MPLLIVMMGVSGSGKSTVGACLAERLGAPFIDGDDLHPPENIAKMSAGQPLDDADRAPWLARIAGQLAAWRDAGSGGVIACSALKRAYRDQLAAEGARFVYLAESPASAAARLAERTGHFMPESLVASQFQALEPPGRDEPVLTAGPAESAEARCAAIYAQLTA